MCGLAGYFMFDGSGERSNEVMLEMLKLQKHRGPDDSGVVAIDTRRKVIEEADADAPACFSYPANLMFGFNRLSILDLSLNGHQPMISADRQVVLMFNGEIYNASDFRDDLIKKGHVFKSTTDTEVILYLYLEYGFDSMIRMLNGMFAIVLLDLRNNRMYLARDRFGIKPLYVLREKGRLAFSSELKCFKALPGFRFELEHEHLDEYLLFRNLINRTLMKNIDNMPPGEYWYYDFSGAGGHVQYHDMDAEGREGIALDHEESMSVLQESLMSSVKRQLVSDVKLGCQLSGGVDSSLVSYYASKYHGDGLLDTISIVFDDPRFSEEKYINYVSNQLGLSSHKYTMRGDCYFDNLEKAIWHYEHPLNHPHTVAIYHLSEHAHEHVTVLLSGEGADEAMAGYSFFRRPTENVYLSRSFLGTLKRNRKSLGSLLAHYGDADCRMVLSSVPVSLDSLIDTYPSFDFSRAIAERLRLAGSIDDDGLNKHRKYEMRAYLQDLLIRQDKMSMAHSIENRVPFLDNEFVSMALSIGSNNILGSHKGKKEEKLLLKQLCSRYFGDDFAFRPKKGLGIPLRQFMRSDSFKDRFHSQWLPGIRSREIFDANPIADWVTNIEKIPGDRLNALWTVIGFEEWARQYLS